MSSLTIGYVTIVAAIALMIVRVPVAIALGSSAIAGLYFVRGSFGPASNLLSSTPYDFAASWTLSAIPMFLVLGAVAFHTGMTGAIYNAARVWFAWVPGGLAVATNMACAVFAAISGSSLATTMAMGKLAIPEMLRLKYDPALTSGVVAAAGTLGALIPPSIAFVIYGYYAETSVAKLLISGILPGLLTAAGYSAMIILRCIRNPDLAPRPKETITFDTRINALVGVWPIPLIMAGIIMTIYVGVATPTEAAAIGAFIAVAISLLQGRLSFAIFRISVVDAARTTASVFFIVVCAAIFTKFLTLTGVPNHLAGSIKNAGVSPLTLIMIITVVYLILGCFLEGLGIMIMTLPILVPICRQLGLDLIWMGVLIVKLIEIGTLTPPVAMHAFAVKSIVGDRVSLTTIYRGIFWFLGVEVVVMALLIAFPAISTWLPSLMD
jgi:tripartite ATP-independent transporter DctM subunit